MRDAGREVSLYRGALPQASSESLAAQLLGRITTASQAAVRAERPTAAPAGAQPMDPVDREIIALRHFEELSNAEAAQVLGLTQAAASNRLCPRDDSAPGRPQQHARPARPGRRLSRRART